MKKIFAFIALSLHVSMSIGQSENATERFTVLHISGKISANDGKPVEGAVVELYEGNHVVERFTTKNSGKFKFHLLNNHIYTIQITKPGYYTKRISVNTYIPDDLFDEYDFEFDIILDSTADKNIYESLAEYPSALISYDPKKDRFYYDKDYTKSYFDEIESN
ncbi:MAG: hypothetical protein Kow0075_02510 [Salibacteraceae bacterium]